MARVNVVLRFNNENGSSFDSIGTTGATNNASLRPFSRELGIDEDTKLPITEPNDGYNCISIGVWKFGDNGRILPKDGYNGYLWGRNETVTLSFIGDNITSIKIDFDKTANQYPKQISVNDDGVITTFTNNSLSVDLVYSYGKGVREVTFSNWNRSNYNACITNIEIEPNEYIMSKRFIQDLETQTQMTTQNADLPSGLIANSGNIDAYDNNGVLQSFGEKGYFNSEFFLLNVEVNGTVIQSHIVTKTDYSSGDKSFTFSCSNDISDFNKIYYEERVYSSEITLVTYLLDILTDSWYIDDIVNIDGSVITKQQQVDAMLQAVIKITDDRELTVKQWLESIIVPSFTRKADSLENGINNVCAVAQLVCYKDSNDKLVFVNARPLATEAEKLAENVLVIESGSHLSDPVHSEITSNWYTEATIK